MLWVFCVVIGIPIVIFLIHGMMRGNATKKVQNQAYQYGWKFTSTEEGGRFVNYIYTRKKETVTHIGKSNKLLFRDEEFGDFAEIEAILEEERKERRRK